MSEGSQHRTLKHSLLPRLCTSLAILCFSFFASDISAQQSPTANSSGVFITRDSLQSYASVLPPELRELVAAGDLVLEVSQSRLTGDHFHSAKRTPASAPAVDQRGVLTPAPTRVSAPIFQVSEVDGSGLQDITRAYQVLWSSASLAWEMGSSATELTLTVFKEPRGDAREVDLLVERIYPQAFGQKPGLLEPLFREKISALSPQVLSPLKWLTLRFLGETEDYLWISSAITGQTRQVTGSNRSDALFTGAFAPDDLFVWSGKVEAVEPTALSFVPMLVPVLEDPIASEQSKREPACNRSAFGSGPIQLNSRSHRFRNAPDWIPTNVRFANRSVWKIELTARDPFSLDARQTLYVDAATYQPIYRSVVGGDGRQLRFVMGVLGTKLGQGDKKLTWAGQLQFSPTDRGRSALVPRSLEICEHLVSGRSVVDFDPSRLAPPPAAGNTPEKTPTPTVIEEGVADD